METPEPDILPKVDEISIVDAEDRLDELWETYLEILDVYTKAQQNIQKSMSSGFFSLARAQSSAPSGRRYGQDWYDERMKARQRTQISSGKTDPDNDSLATGSQSLTISITPEELREDAKESVNDDSNTEAENEFTAQQPSPPSTPEPEQSSERAKDQETEDDVKTRIVDPLRWYGILVPPELKKAQVSFASLLHSSETSEQADGTAPEHSPFADAVNAARGLREIEADIRKARKTLRKAEKAKPAAIP